MITQYRLTVNCNDQLRLPSFWGYRLYAWLLERLPETCSAALHESGGSLITQYLYYDRARNENNWIINLFSDELETILTPVLSKTEEIRLHDIRLQARVSDIQRITSAEQLILSARSEHSNNRYSKLELLTPAAFKQNGKYTVLPEPRLILRSLAAKWTQIFPDYPLDDEDALKALEQGLRITDYKIRTVRYPLKNVKIPGFMGEIIIEAKLSDPLMEIWKLLLCFSNYGGTGIKTALGMGGTVYIK
ncbi:MAG: CRISPR-associated endoribonuclease Cas6 [Eubacteriaceae bacterium]|jgi:CRISPR-associated endoribonuclease Cas6